LKHRVSRALHDALVVFPVHRRTHNVSVQFRNSFQRNLGWLSRMLSQRVTQWLGTVTSMVMWAHCSRCLRMTWTVLSRWSLLRLAAAEYQIHVLRNTVAVDSAIHW